MVVGFVFFLGCNEAPDKTEEPSTPKIEVYVDNPTDSEPPVIFNKLYDLLGTAKTSVYCALSHLTINEIAEKLVELHKSGVDVKIVADVDSYSSTNRESGFEILVDNDVPVVFGDGELVYLPDPYLNEEIVRTSDLNIMSHNFVIVDNLYIWNSMAGPTVDVLTETYNVGCLLRSEEMANSYYREFNQLSGGVFSISVDTYNSPNKSITHFDSLEVGNMEFYTNFGPQEHPIKILIDEIFSAKASISISTEQIVNEDYILNALIYKKKAGFYVEVIVEDSEIDVQKDILQDLKDAGIIIKQDTNNTTIHGSLILIDYYKSPITGIKYPSKAFVLTHPLYRSYAYERDPNSNGIPNLTDGFCDSTMWSIHGIQEQADNEAITKLYDFFKKIYNSGTDF